MSDFKPPFEVYQEAPKIWDVIDSDGLIFSTHSGDWGKTHAESACDSANRLAGYEPPRTVTVEIPVPDDAMFCRDTGGKPFVWVQYEDMKQAQQFLDAIKEVE